MIAKPFTRFNTIDLLRFVAVVIVVFGHFTDTFNRIYQIVPENLKLTPVFRYGHISLCILFIISGYVVTMSSIKKDIKAFIITRFIRLYPIFWVSCIVAFILPYIPYLPSFMAKSSGSGFFANMTMMPFLFDYAFLSPVFWTLIIELIFYIFLGFIIVFKLWKNVLPVIVIVLLYCIFSTETGNAIVRFMPFFIAGMLFYFIDVKYDTKWKLYTLLAVTLFASLQGMKYLADELRPEYIGNNGYHVEIIWILVILSFIGFHYLIIKKPNLPNHPIYQVLGNSSYPMYLFHLYWLPIYWYFRNMIQPQILLLMVTILIFLSSWLINILIEKPFALWVRSMIIKLYYLFNFTNKRSKA